MPEVPYTGVPSALPQTGAPDDYQRITPAAAEGLAQFGQGASQAGQFFGQAAADDQTNNVLDGASKLLYGDPSKTITGLDGQPIQDTGFFGLKGRQALDARPQVEASLDNLIKSARGNLSTPEQTLQFDNFTRRYRTSLSMDIGRFTDQQSDAWIGDVNDASAQNAINGITQNAGNPGAVANFASDLINARVKQAQLKGAQPGDPVYQSTITQAKAEAAKAQIMAVGANDPGQALRMTNNYKAILGTDYGALIEHFQTRGDQKIGQDFVANYNATKGPADAAAYAASPANPKNPVYSEVSQQLPGGMSANGLARLIQIESGGRDVTNKFGYTGYAQFGKAEWAQYGAGGNPHDLADSVAAAQRYSIANGRYLTKVLGRPATDAELYLAHQQGAGGAAALLSNPNATAASLLGYSHVYNNLPASLRAQAATMTGAEFASYWTHRFNGTTPAAANASPPQEGPRSEIAGPAVDQSVPANGIPASPDEVGAGPAAPAPTPVAAVQATGTPPTPIASIYQAIQNSDMTDQQKQYAFAEAERRQREQTIADDATAAQIKQVNEAAMDKYTSQILLGQFPTQEQIAADTNLTAEGKDAIYNMTLRHADESPAAAAQAYGPGYAKAYQQILAQPGDPSRISDPVQIYRMAEAGGPITVAGAQKLVGILGQVTRSVDDAAVNTAKSSLLTYAKSKLSFDTTDMPNVPGVQPLKDPQGEMLFNSQFVPQFEAKFDQWVKAGNDPWKFLDPANVDGMISQLRNPREMALAKLEAQNNVTPTDVPAPPVGTDPNGWAAVIGMPAVSKTGVAWTPQLWAQAITTLIDNPTPDVIRQFNEQFPNLPLDANGLLSVLQPAGVTDRQEQIARQINAGARKSEDAGSVAPAPPAEPSFHAMEPIPMGGL